MAFNLHAQAQPAPELLRGAPATPLLLLSVRRLSDLVAYCLTYELEDVLQGLTGADRVMAGDARALEWSRRGYRYLRKLSGSAALAARLAPPPPRRLRLTRDYPAFVAVFNDPYEVYALACVPDWRARCDRAVCFINEVWAHQLPDYLLETLRAFDHVYLGVSAPVAAVQRLSGTPCSYLPFAADVLRFSPYPDRPARDIGVCNIGRRSDVTHAALLQLADRRRLFYHYDTVASSADGRERSFRVNDPAAHRLLFANILRRSRYFFANRARINEPDHVRGVQEISGRFYEGAAAGTVMLGEAPDTDSFRAQFGWTDAVLPLPYECPDIAQRLAELDAQPERLARISRDNARHAARSHDWLHRVQRMFAELQLAPTAAMAERAQRLQAIAQAAEQDADR